MQNLLLYHAVSGRKKTIFGLPEATWPYISSEERTKKESV